MSDKKIDYDQLYKIPEEDRFSYLMADKTNLNADELTLLKYCYNRCDNIFGSLAITIEKLNELLDAEIIDAVMASLVIKGYLLIYRSSNYVLITFNLK